MSARDVIAKAEVEFLCSDVPVIKTHGSADAIISALTAAGYDIVGPGELHKATVEKCAEVAEERQVAGDLHPLLIRHNETCLEVATAIRSLASKEDGL